MAAIDVTVTVKGPLFSKKIDDVVKRRLVATALGSIDRRLQRGGRGLGEQRNTTTTNIHGLTLSVAYTKRPPRVTGKSKQRKQIAQTKALARNSMNKAAREIAEELR